MSDDPLVDPEGDAAGDVLDADWMSSTLDAARRARSGDELAWAELDAKLRPWLTDRLLWDRVPNGYDVADVIQDVLLYVHQNFDQFRVSPDSSMRAWLLRIAESKLIDLWRRADAKKRGGGRERHIGSFDGVGIRDRMPDDRGMAQSGAARQKELEAGLLAIQGKLSAKHRQVLELREEMELPFEDIAVRMGYSKAVTVRSLFMRARVRRAELLRDHDPGGEV